LKHLRKQSGYTLIELMAASLILVVGILAVSGILMRGYKAMTTAETRSDALHSTQKDIEAVIQREDPDAEVIVDEQYPYYLQFDNFGIQVRGRLITVKKIAPGLPEGQVIYQTFVPDEGVDE